MRSCMLSISCSRRSTRSTPARLSPSSAVISWMRRSLSTSSWEYSRVPLGERLGSISPRVSYMRSVCGCMLASWAATEIMNTPRSVSICTRIALRGIVGPLGGEQPVARVCAHRLRQLIDRLFLLLAEMLGHVDHEAVVDVAFFFARAELGGALAAQALDGAVRSAGTHAQRLRAVECGHAHLSAAQRLGDGQRDLHLEVVSLAGEHGRGRHVGEQVQVAGWATVAPGLALARQADAAAVTHARGDVHAQTLDRGHRTCAVARWTGILNDRAR